MFVHLNECGVCRQLNDLRRGTLFPSNARVKNIYEECQKDAYI